MSAAVIERTAKRSNKNAVPTSPPGLSPADAAFNEGRDMVIAMITKAQAIEEDRADSSTWPARWARIGRAQNRFCEAYLQRLIDKPDCLHGFAAALSAYLAWEGRIPPPPSALLEPMAEYLEGKPGADGTKGYPDDMGEAELLEHERYLRELAEAGPNPDKVVPELQPRSTVTWDTDVSKAGQKGNELMLECTWEIDALRTLLIDLAANQRADGEKIHELPLQMRTIAVQIGRLNNHVMSFLDTCDTVTLGDVYKTLHGSTVGVEL